MGYFGQREHVFSDGKKSSLAGFQGLRGERVKVRVGGSYQGQGGH